MVKQIKLRSVVRPDATNVQRLALYLSAKVILRRRVRQLKRELCQTHPCNPLGVKNVRGLPEYFFCEPWLKQRLDKKLWAESYLHKANYGQELWKLTASCMFNTIPFKPYDARTPIHRWLRKFATSINRNISTRAPSQMRKSSSIIIRYDEGGEGDCCERDI